MPNHALISKPELIMTQLECSWFSKTMNWGLRYLRTFSELRMQVGVEKTRTKNGTKHCCLLIAGEISSSEFVLLCHIVTKTPMLSDQCHASLSIIILRKIVTSLLPHLNSQS